MSTTSRPTVSRARARSATSRPTISRARQRRSTKRSNRMVAILRPRTRRKRAQRVPVHRQKIRALSREGPKIKALSREGPQVNQRLQPHLFLLLQSLPPQRLLLLQSLPPHRLLLRRHRPQAHRRRARRSQRLQHSSCTCIRMPPVLQTRCSCACSSASCENKFSRCWLGAFGAADPLQLCLLDDHDAFGVVS